MEKNKTYIPLYESKMDEFKAWYLPSTDKLITFSRHGLHIDYVENELHLKSMDEAIKKGYISIMNISAGHMGITSYRKPDDRLFLSLRYQLELVTKVSKIKEVVWEVQSERRAYRFPNQSFFFSDDINDAGGIL